jgi:hypothetical protein
MNDASPTVSEMITVEYTEYVAIVAMVHRPYNLSGPDLYRSLLDAFEAAMKAGSRAILLKSGLRHFCAGADVSLWDERIANQGKARLDPVEVLRGFENLPIPIVAAVHGACLGGGALGVVLHPGLQEYAIGPDVDIVPRRQIALLPALVLALPLRLQARYHRRRQVRRILAEQRRERLPKIAGRDAAQIEDRQQDIQALRPPRPQRRDRRSEADPVGPGRAAVPHLGPDDLHRADPVAIWRAGPWPCRTTRARPSGSFNSAVVSRNVCSSISTALASRSRAPFRRISVSGSSTADG